MVIDALTNWVPRFLNHLSHNKDTVMPKSLTLTPARVKDLTELLRIAQIELTQQLTERSWITNSSLNDEFERLRSRAADLVSTLEDK